MYRKLGEKLLYLRLNRNMSQKLVATRIGVERKTYAAYENGTRLPQVDKIIKLCQLYHVTADYILGIRGDKN